ncbi:MAG TPA: hypothetical protein VGR48_08515 [Terriglobales bacterium]|nr:hypothetical protein [Terriglobales bacterium]
MDLVYLAHGLVQNGGDHASMGVARRSGVAPPQAKAADKPLPLLVEGESQAHAFGVVFAAGKAVILLPPADVSTAYMLFAHKAKLVIVDGKSSRENGFCWMARLSPGLQIEHLWLGTIFAR